MKLFVPILLCLPGLPAFAQVPAADGFYLRAHDESNDSVAGQDGSLLFLGGRRHLHVLGCRLLSQDNANTRFTLSVVIPYDEAVSTQTYVLVVKGIAYAQGGCGASGTETSSLHFDIAGETAAKSVSAFLGTPLLLRGHPGHRFRVTLTPVKEVCGPGEDVNVTLRIVNVGPDTVAFLQGGRNRAARDNQYMFSAYLAGKQVRDIGTTVHWGGRGVKRVLEPGAVFEDTVCLGKWFAFGEPGTYEVLGTYYLGLLDPGSDSYRTLWEDYVAAECLVRIAAD